MNPDFQTYPYLFSRSIETERLITLMPKSSTLSPTLAKTTCRTRFLRGMKELLKSRKIQNRVPSKKNSSKVMKNSEMLCFPASLRISRQPLDSEVPVNQCNLYKNEYVQQVAFDDYKCGLMETEKQLKTAVK